MKSFYQFVTESKANPFSHDLVLHNPKDVTNEIKKHQKAGLPFGPAKRKA